MLLTLNLVGFAVIMSTNSKTAKQNEEIKREISILHRSMHVLAKPRYEVVKGPVGPMGPTGIPGADGKHGTKGERGFQGDRGIEGAQGEIGLTGAPGSKGHRGAKGEQGEEGTLTSAAHTAEENFVPKTEARIDAYAYYDDDNEYYEYDEDNK